MSVSAPVQVYECVVFTPDCPLSPSPPLCLTIYFCQLFPCVDQRLALVGHRPPALGLGTLVGDLNPFGSARSPRGNKKPFTCPTLGELARVAT